MYGAPAAQAVPFPIYTLVVAIIDMVFCVLRLALVGMGIYGLTLIMRRPDAGSTVAMGIAEVVSGAAMVVLGIAANGMILAKKRPGVIIGWMLVAATGVSLGLGLFQGFMQMSRFQPGSPQFVGAIIGIVLVVGLRIGIIVAYAFALLMFQKWLARTSS